VIDPIDGTANFLRNTTPWAISIGFADDLGPAVGVVTIPDRDQQFTATRGLGAFLNGVRLRVRTEVDPSVALVGTGFSYDPVLRSRWMHALEPVISTVADLRRSGSAAADLCSVASGSTDAFMELDLSPWDVAAGLLIAAEAGCTVRRFDREDRVDALAAAPGLEDILLPVLLREHQASLTPKPVRGHGVATSGSQDSGGP
jgi:myo-inositol-1(or 4)-monophosphatase